MVCLVPRLSGVGGMVSFRQKLEQGLKEKGFVVTDSPAEVDDGAVLVIGGTRQIPALVRARQRGALIVQRLDGMNWIHRLGGTGVRHYLRSEYGNFLLRLIRSKVANRLVYQSAFARQWWEEAHGGGEKFATIIHNGVDLKMFSPGGNPPEVKGKVRVLLVEGSLQGGYEIGLESACQLVMEMASQIAHSHLNVQEIELTVVGKVSPDSCRRGEARLSASFLPVKTTLHWTGVLHHDAIPEIDRSAHLFFSADINAACPNSVIEAMACGTPVIAYDTGALGEIVGSEGGRIVPYGGDPWKLDAPDAKTLALVAREMLDSLKSYQQRARIRAEKFFDVNSMVEKYAEVLELN